MDELIQDLKDAEDSTDACVVLLDYCFSDEDKLSDNQLSVLLNIFDEPELASYSLMYIFGVLAEEMDLIDLSEVYSIVQAKFTKREKDESSLIYGNSSIRA